MCPTRGSRDTAANKAGSQDSNVGTWARWCLALHHHAHWAPQAARLCCVQTHACADRASAPKGEGRERLRTTLTFSSCSMQGVCTTILQAAHFLRGTDFCYRREGAPEAPGNPSQGAPRAAEESSRLPQHICPPCAPGTPTIDSWHWDTAPPSSHHPQMAHRKGAQV